MDKFELGLQLVESIVKLHRKQGLSVVFTNGCFDLIHRGHVCLLYEAAQYGELIVAVNSDSSVRSLKGPGRPLNYEDDRRVVVSSIRPVSYAFLFDALDTAELLDRLRPDFVVKSAEWAQGLKSCEQAVCAQHGIQVVFLEPLPGYSTTQILDQR